MTFKLIRLKQKSKGWNIQFDETIKEFGVPQNAYEDCVYNKVSGSAVVFLVLYMWMTYYLLETTSQHCNLSKFGYLRISP